MAVEIKVPDIEADEVEITEILVKVGSKVEVKQSLVTIEGDRASMEVPPLQTGVVKEIKVFVGDKAKTSKLIMIFGSAEDAAAAISMQGEKKEAASATAVPAAVAATKEVHIPDIGSDEAEITEIMVRVDDAIAAEQSLITVEGDKASMEVPVPLAGTVGEIKINTGDKVFTGPLIMVSEVAGAASVVTPAQATAPAAATPAAVGGVKDINVPGIDGDEVEVIEVMIKVDDKVTTGQSLITVKGDRASMEVPAPFTGTAKEIKINTGDKVKTGFPIVVLEVKGTAPAATSAQVTALAPVTAPTQATKPTATPTMEVEGKAEFTESDAYVHATPLTRRLVHEFGVNLAKMKGTGRKGRTPREDVQAYMKGAVKRAESTPAATIGGGIPGMLPWPKVNFSEFGGVEGVELGCIQKISGANLSRNWVMVLYVTHFDKTDITDLEAFRKRQNAGTKERRLDMKFTPVVFIMKAAATVPERMPRFNSSLSKDSQRLTLKKYINIGAAVGTPDSLVVPVFKDMNRKSVAELSRELTTISKEARDDKSTAGEIWDDCLTISSIDGLSITYFAPIVNTLEVAILGMSKSAVEPIWNGREFVPRLIMPTSLPLDRRVIGGADGACFITIVNNTLSDTRCLVI